MKSFLARFGVIITCLATACFFFSGASVLIISGMVTGLTASLLPPLFYSGHSGDNLLHALTDGSIGAVECMVQLVLNLLEFLGDALSGL